MDRRFLSILAAIAILFIGIAVFTNKSGDNKSSGGSSKSQATSHITGDGQKGVTLIEYGDFQCPVCEAYEPTVAQLRTQFTNDIHFQFRNLPLSSIHPNAFAAARAAEAAGLQNKYWQMHDTLYEQANWQNWTTSSNPVPLFDSYAQKLGLNLDKFKADYTSSQVNNAINADLAAFDKTSRKKEKGTPTFFLDGQYLPNTELTDPQTGAPSVSKFSQKIQAEITKKTAAQPQPAPTPQPSPVPPRSY